MTIHPAETMVPDALLRAPEGGHAREGVVATDANETLWIWFGETEYVVEFGVITMQSAIAGPHLAGCYENLGDAGFVHAAYDGVDVFTTAIPGMKSERALSLAHRRQVYDIDATG